MTRVVVIAIGFAVAIGFGLATGHRIELSRQNQIATILQASAAIIFGFVGVWIGLVYPAAIEKLRTAKSDLKEIERRVRTLMWAVAILVVTLCTSLAATTVMPVIVEGRPPSQPEPDWLRSVAFAALNVFAAVQILTLILTMYPLLGLYMDFSSLLQNRKSKQSIRRSSNTRDDDPE